MTTRSRWQCGNYRDASRPKYVPDRISEKSLVPCGKFVVYVKKTQDAQAVYIAERGSTVNNPYITETFLRTFLGTNREIVGRTNCGPQLRQIAKAFVREYPGHQAAILVK
jgi:hypothetical protein